MDLLAIVALNAVFWSSLTLFFRYATKQAYQPDQPIKQRGL